MLHGGGGAAGSGIVRCMDEVGAGALYDPKHPARPPRFTGRGALLRRLGEALDGAESISLIGDSRIGKSSLLVTWEQEARRRGRTVCLVSGEDPEGASVGALVRAVTGREAPDDADRAADVLAGWLETAGRPGLPPLVLIDEMEAPVRNIERRFFERLRAMVGRRAIVLVLASRRDLSLVFEEAGSTSPFETCLHIARVGLLEVDAAEAIMGWSAGVLDEGEHARMRAWAGRHPYFLQLLGRHLIDARRHGEPLADAMRAARTASESSLQRLWTMLTQPERTTLREIASGKRPSRILVADRLTARGVLTEDGHLFGNVLAEWIEIAP